MAQTNGANGVQKPDYDAIIVGAGFAGLRMIHEMRQRNMTFKVIEYGTGVGGTWYWNRYPGARTDSESWIYILNFSKELNDDWTWKERFPRQPEVLEYLNHVADRFDMRKDIQFKTKVKSAHWDESKNVWTTTTEGGESWTSTYFVSASGVLSVGRELPFEGAKNFKGEAYRTYAWPKEEVNFEGKRVAVVGTGATSVQIIPMVAHLAKSVHVFQRTPNFVLPARNYPITDEQHRDIKKRYEEIWEGARSQIFGMSMVDSKITMDDMKSEKQHRQVLENGWEIGGFRFIFETFADMLTSQKSNDIASEFVRDKIRAVVNDEETAELLCPDHAIMAKRPPLGHGYFETYNKPHVHLVDIKSNPIKTVTETGIQLEGKDKRLEQDEFEFDMIIFAIGFDAGTGALATMDIRGTDKNVTLGEQWNEHLNTFLGITMTGYPNMFMLSAPQSPFANLPIVMDNTATWISDVLKYMQENNKHRMEPTQEAMDKWTRLLTDVYEATVLPEAATKAGSWYIGANIPGKRVNPLFWFGGVVSYFEICDNEANNKFPSLEMA